MNNKIIGFCVIFMIIVVILFLFGIKYKCLNFDNTINLSAILTFFSVLIATFAFIVTLNNSNNNQKQYNEQQKQKKLADERNQALNIAGWFNGYSDPSADRSYPRAKVTIINSTNIPVYQMFIFMVPNKNEIEFEKLNNSGNTSPHLIKYLELVKPGETNTEVNAGGNFAGGGHDSVAILFKDASSKYWYRSNFGSLKEINQTQVFDKFQTNSIFGPYQQYSN
ncbi:hypothetical protein [Leuconostoc gasicomitatum]|uniref:hypothetical protein n=1 Tax=Leuconostoc gasicomitatum TaxID=115778 RepID=UPI0015CC336F|nr:hypothetical protein [Leuconostoc gasicomitatum]QLG77563.1 hypothetical protein LeuG3613_01290 [Leuconostoc gasicomitatum]